jgi:hypothetical protein
MTTRQTAGRIARRRGADAEHEASAFLRESGHTVHRVKHGPYDLVAFGGPGRMWVVAQIKSYLLAPATLEQAKKELVEARLPKGTLTLVMMKNRRRGDKRAASGRKWVVVPVRNSVKDLEHTP